jgi:hypothetical protein
MYIQFCNKVDKDIETNSVYMLWDNPKMIWVKNYELAPPYDSMCIEQELYQFNRQQAKE